MDTFDARVGGPPAFDMLRRSASSGHHQAMWWLPREAHRAGVPPYVRPTQGLRRAHDIPSFAGTFRVAIGSGEVRGVHTGSVLPAAFLRLVAAERPGIDQPPLTAASTATSTPGGTTVRSPPRSRTLSGPTKMFTWVRSDARLVADATADRRVDGGEGVEDSVDGDGLVDLDRHGRGAAGVFAQRGGQPDGHGQGSTAVFTHVTGGRWRATSRHESPPSAEAKTSPVRVPR